MDDRRTLPPESEMYRAMRNRVESYEGLFVVAVRSTGVFCRPTCPGRKPKRENVEFYASARDAILAGYRPCLRCRPLEPNGRPPDWLRPLLAEIERDPKRRWRDADLRARGLNPVRIRRWFKAQHGMTFQGYGRARRLGLALGHIRQGADQTSVAFDHGYESLSGFRDAFARAFGSPPGSARSARVMYLTRILTPLGPMVAGAVDAGVCLLEFADRRMLERQLSVVGRRLDAELAPGAHPHLEKLSGELEEYFSGARRHFETPLALPGTKFQLACWEQLRGIPYGATTTYAELARAVGRLGAERAVGRANGENRIAVVVPCHRVIRSDGALAGYGGGLWRKRYLLDHERRHSGC